MRDILKVLVLCTGILATTARNVYHKPQENIKPVNLLEQYLKYHHVPLMAEEGCNATAYNDTLDFNNTNRCLGVPCKRNDQCNSTYCVTNQPSKELPASFICANETFKPTCNFSKLFQTYDQDEHLKVVQSTSICGDVPCDWDADCLSGLKCALINYQYPPVCTGYEPPCNSSAEVVSGKNYDDGTLTTSPSTNRCYNVNCMKNTECTTDL